MKQGNLFDELYDVQATDDYADDTNPSKCCWTLSYLQQKT